MFGFIIFVVKVKIMKKRFVILVLDGFGIGAMEDAGAFRESDKDASTLGSLLKDYPDLYLPNLEKMGLMNAYGKESARMHFSEDANFGRSALQHSGADTFMGHQEIMGSVPKDPDMIPFQDSIDRIAEHLKENGHKVEYLERDGLKFLLCDDYATIADNLETDPGMIYNVTAPHDFLSFEKEGEIARLVREAATVSRIVYIGGEQTTLDDLMAAVEIRQGHYIGVNAIASKSYNHNYQCRHLGYGVEPDRQVPTILYNHGIDCVLIGKVADVVFNKSGRSFSCVPTDGVIDLLKQALNEVEYGFICANVQETDLSGHAESHERFKEVLEIVDRRLPEVFSLLNDEDIFLIQADHGNDPDVGHSKHTREYVPVLIRYGDMKKLHLGTLKTMSDIGATVADFLHVEAPENGTSFLPVLEEQKQKA